MTNAKFKIEWVDGKSETRNRPDPRSPLGVDLDISKGASVTCKIALPYPARRIGFFIIKCETCGLTGAVSTAGRADDPRSIKMACKGN